MNLRSIAAHLKPITADGFGKFQIVNNVKAGTTFGVKNLNAFRSTLTQISGIPALRTYFDLAMGTSLFKRIGDELEFPPVEFHMLEKISHALQAMIPVFLETLNSVIGEEKENTIYIRLPDSTDLKYVAETMEQIEKILAQLVYHPKIGGRIELVGWEKGSLWLEILLGVSAASYVVAHTVRSAAVAYRRILDNRMIAVQIDALEAKSESAHDIKNGMKKLVDTMVDAEGRQIYDKYFKGEVVDNEQIERIKHSIEKLAQLMDKGAEVKPGLLLPPEVKTEFPDMKNLTSVVSSIKQIGQG